MLSLNDVAQIFQLPPGTIRRWCKQGEIKTYRTGPHGSLQFRHEDVAIAYLTKSIKQCLGH